MCYNSSCRIEIKSIIDGTLSTVTVQGKVVKSPSDTHFDYTLDGDKCTLTLTDSEVVQLREGEQNIKMTFRKGEKAECVLSSGGFLGTFPVFTHELIKKESAKNLILKIIYTIGEQKVELDFSAQYK